MTPLQKYYDENRLIRGRWSRTDEQGRELLCLYTALVGDPQARPWDCPADKAPLWLAHLLPWIDDAGTREHWLEVVARVVRLAPGFAALAPEVDYRVRAAILSQCRKHNPEICDRVIDLCDRAGRGETVSPDEWAAAARGARWAAARATAAAAAAAAAAEEAAREEAARDAARDAAREAAGEVEWDPAREAAAADKIIDAILDVLEEAICQTAK